MPAEREDVHIGYAPLNEDRPEVGTDGYHWAAWHQCRALVGQLRRVLGPEPPKCRLYTKENDHPAGKYFSVNVSFPAGDERGRSYARRCETELPEQWDEEARKELRVTCRKPTVKQASRATPPAPVASAPPTPPPPPETASVPPPPEPPAAETPKPLRVRSRTKQPAKAKRHSAGSNGKGGRREPAHSHPR